MMTMNKRLFKQDSHTGNQASGMNVHVHVCYYDTGKQMMHRVASCLMYAVSVLRTSCMHAPGVLS